MKGSGRTIKWMDMAGLSIQIWTFTKESSVRAERKVKAATCVKEGVSIKDSSNGVSSMD